MTEVEKNRDKMDRVFHLLNEAQLVLMEAAEVETAEVWEDQIRQCRNRVVVERNVAMTLRHDMDKYP